MVAGIGANGTMTRRSSENPFRPRGEGMEHHLEHKLARHMAHVQGRGEAIGSSEARRFHHQHFLNRRFGERHVTWWLGIQHLEGRRHPFVQGPISGLIIHLVATAP